MKRIIALFILYNFILISVFSNELRFKHISINDGLISNTVNVIIQDSEGYMWFGTQDGLCRYDGYNFLSFIHSPDNPNSLSNSTIERFSEDVDGNLWIGTRNGINKLNLEDYSIERISVFEDSLTAVPIQALLPVSDSQLYFGVDYKGLFKMDLNTKEIKNYQPSVITKSSIISTTIYSLAEDKSKGIYVGTDQGLQLFNPLSESFTTILKSENISYLGFGPDSCLNIGIVTHGNYYYQLQQSGRLDTIYVPILSNNKYMSIMDSREGNTWVGIRDKGVFFSNPKLNIYQSLIYKKHDFSGLNSNTIASFYEDRDGNIWLGTHDSGINLHEKHGKGFIHVQDNFQENGLRNNRVRSMIQDSDGDIWIGTKINGTLAKFDRTNMTFTHYGHDPNDPKSICNDLIFCMTEDKPGFLWVGTSNGLSYFNKKTGRSTTLCHDPANSNSIKNNNIYALFKDGNDLYIGYLVDGMDVYNTKTKRIRHFNYNAGSGSISDMRVRNFLKDSQENFWVATSNGLNLFDKEKGIFTPFYHNPNDSLSISNNSIVCLYEDVFNNLWVGTRWGINRMNRNNNSFKRFTTKDGLSDNAIKGILGDSKGNIWISTSNGLSKYNPQTNTFKNYTTSDGLQANEFMEFAFCKTRDGELMFGGNNGFNIFNPEHIIDNDIIPEVHITDFKLFNRQVKVNMPDSPLKKRIGRCNEITLTHKQSVMTFEYVALNYISPEKNQYAYKMEGFEDKWNEVGTQRSATYTNLDAGEYTFRVKAANNDGYWNETGTSLRIKILPPPWLSWWAYSIYAVFILALIFMLLKYTAQRAKKEKQRENDQRNLSFFINVSHEFRTPLTLMFAPIKKLLTSFHTEEDKEAVESINQSANKLLHLVNQLLDFRKADLGHIQLQVQKQNIVEFSEKVLSQFQPISKSKNINLGFNFSEEKIEVYFDPDKYEKILTNLLSNAIKYTNPGGSVNMGISKVNIAPPKKPFVFFNGTRVNSFVEVSVYDTGKGLSTSQLKRAFDRFYSDDQSNTGIGVGLNYTKSLVELHKGHITVESSEGNGSKFIVRLPLSSTLARETEKKQINTIDEFGTIHLESLKYDISTTDTVPAESGEITETKNTKLPLILIIEDNKKLRTQLKEELKGQYVVKEAINGQDGLDKANQLYPDIIISDVMMPVMDGIELCSKLKSSLHTAHIPVILLTAKNLIQHKIEGYQTGADDYISKPFSMVLLKIRLNNLIESRQKLKEKYVSTSVNMPGNNFTTNNLDEVFLDKVTQLVLDNLNNPDFNQKLFEVQMGMSRSGLYKKIHSLTGYSTSIFIRNVKLKHAAGLILSGQHPIKEIAYITGFSSPSYFNTSFRKLYGKTPMQYANENQEGSLIDE